MGKQTPAEKRSDLINLLWKFKHGVQNKENLDFPSLLANPMYRRTALQRLGGDPHSGQFRALFAQIADLDPGVDLNTDLALTAFEHPRPQQNGIHGTQDRARYFIGAGLMLIAVTVLFGLITIKLTADGFGNAHAAQQQKQINSAKHLAQQSADPRRP